MRRTSTFAVARTRAQLRAARSQAIRFPAPSSALRLTRRGLVAAHAAFAWTPGPDRLVSHPQPGDVSASAPRDSRAVATAGEDPAERHEGPA